MESESGLGFARRLLTRAANGPHADLRAQQVAMVAELFFGTPDPALAFPVSQGSVLSQRSSAQRARGDVATGAASGDTAATLLSKAATVLQLLLVGRAMHMIMVHARDDGASIHPVTVGEVEIDAFGIALRLDKARGKERVYLWGSTQEVSLENREGRFGCCTIEYSAAAAGPYVLRLCPWLSGGDADATRVRLAPVPLVWPLPLDPISRTYTLCTRACHNCPDPLAQMENAQWSCAMAAVQHSRRKAVQAQADDGAKAGPSEAAEAAAVRGRPRPRPPSPGPPPQETDEERRAKLFDLLERGARYLQPQTLEVARAIGPRVARVDNFRQWCLELFQTYLRENGGGPAPDVLYFGDVRSTPFRQLLQSLPAANEAKGLEYYEQALAWVCEAQTARQREQFPNMRADCFLGAADHQLLRKVNRRSEAELKGDLEALRRPDSSKFTPTTTRALDPQLLGQFRGLLHRMYEGVPLQQDQVRPFARPQGRGRAVSRGRLRPQAGKRGLSSDERRMHAARHSGMLHNLMVLERTTKRFEVPIVFWDTVFLFMYHDWCVLNDYSALEADTPALNTEFVRLLGQSQAALLHEKLAEGLRSPSAEDPAYTAFRAAELVPLAQRWRGYFAFYVQLRGAFPLVTYSFASPALYLRYAPRMVASDDSAALELSQPDAQALGIAFGVARAALDDRPPPPPAPGSAYTLRRDAHVESIRHQLEPAVQRIAAEFGIDLGPADPEIEPLEWAEYWDLAALLPAGNPVRRALAPPQPPPPAAGAKGAGRRGSAGPTGAARRAGEGQQEADPWTDARMDAVLDQWLENWLTHVQPKRQAPEPTSPA